MTPKIFVLVVESSCTGAEEDMFFFEDEITQDEQAKRLILSESETVKFDEMSLESSVGVQFLCWPSRLLCVRSRLGYVILFSRDYTFVF